MKKKIITFSLFCFISIIHAEERNIPYFSYRKLTEEEIKAHFGDMASDEKISFHGAWNLEAKHFPPNQKYTLYCNNLAQKPIKLGECFADENGKMLLHSSRRPETMELTGHIFSYGNFLPGEPVEFSLIHKNRKNKEEYHLFIIPNPLEIEDPQGRKMSMCILTPDCTVFAFELTNFKPNEKIKTVSISGNERIYDETHVGKDGALIVTIQPAVINKKRGTATFKAMPIETGVALGINYDWGPPR